jgi:hypothetical protein
MELKIEEGRVYGLPYHTVQPMFSAHPQTWFKQEWKEMEDWCVQTMGLAGSLWANSGLTPKLNYRWYMNDSKFWFREQSDLTMFILKWS